MSLSFGLTASSALQELRDAVSTFRQDELNETLARECALKAWHLCDHFFDECGTKSSFANLKSLKRHVKQACPELGYLQAICNASKHGRNTKPSQGVTDTNKLDGDFCREDFDPHDFNVPRLEITLSDGQKLLFDDVLYCAMSFWVRFFRNHGLT